MPTVVKNRKVKIGREARSRLTDLLSEKLGMVLTNLTREYKGGTMTPDKALGFVAELACLEGLVSVVQREADEERRS